MHGPVRSYSNFTTLGRIVSAVIMTPRNRGNNCLTSRLTKLEDTSLSEMKTNASNFCQFINFVLLVYDHYSILKKQIIYFHTFVYRREHCAASLI